MARKQKVLLTGATGFIGKHIEAMLLTENYDVISISRRSGHHFKNMCTTTDWMPLLSDIDIVINSVGIIVQNRQQSFDTIHHHAPAALFQACAMAKIKQVIQISALGADNNAYTPYQSSKYAADKVLLNLAINRTIMRPSLVYGKGGTSMKMFKALSSLPIIPLAGNGLYQVQPIHISDLVEAIKQCLDSKTERLILNLVGPKPLTFIDWLQAFRTAQQKSPAKTITIPTKLVLLFATFGRFVIPILHPDNLHMLLKGSTADAQPLTDLLGRSPLSVKEGLCHI